MSVSTCGDQAGKPESPSNNWKSARRGRILLIEDDQVDRENVHRLLNGEFELIDAISGREGLQSLESHSVACVLMDYRLPDVDGLDLLDRLAGELTPLVMLTGQGNEEVAVEAMKRGAQDYLSKDALNTESLRRAIFNAMEKVALRRRIRDQQQELRRRAAELKRSNLDLEQFAYVASHDLQEPLRAVSGYCELLRAEYSGRLDGAADEYIEHAVEGARRMQAMIQGLLAYSRAGRECEPPQPTHCAAVAEEALRNLRATLNENGAQVDVGEMPIIPAEPRGLVQLFQNLIGNAVKYRSEQSPRIRIRAERRGEEWLFSVGDNGIGIPPEFRKRIFTIFGRLHTREEYPGTGLGLAISGRIVERHGGRIWVESEPGQGSVFYFTIPAGDDREADSSEQRDER